MTETRDLSRAEAAPAPQAAAGPRELVVQRLLGPDRAINLQRELFFSARGAAGWDARRETWVAAAGAPLRFSAYFNALDLGALAPSGEDVLVLELEGEGEALVEMVHAPAPGRRESLTGGRVRLVPGAPVRLELPAPPDRGLMHLELSALEHTELRRADWSLRSDHFRPVRIAAVITTFRRDAAVQATAARLRDWLEANPDMAGALELWIIDNGGDTDAVPFPGARVVRNRNLGGAGGFTRGLLEARDAGRATHALFMDDDALFFPENLRRTRAVLARAGDPRAAVAGAMISSERPDLMWENTAVFDGLCRPFDSRRPLEDFDDVVAMARQKGTGPRRYGAWWYFCFPLAEAKRLPFPFFVRGDDIYFSLANDFDIRTICGVASRQESFESKRSALTEYLDLRNHLVQHLAHPQLDASHRRLAAMIGFFFHRVNDTYDYAGAQAALQAVRDVAEGPEFWDRDPEMGERRAWLKRIEAEQEARSRARLDLTRLHEAREDAHVGPLWQALRRLSLHGHLLPARAFYSKALKLEERRGKRGQVFLRPGAVVTDAEGTPKRVMAADRRLYFENRRALRETLRLLEARLPELRAAYAAQDCDLITEAAWRRRLGI